MSTSQVLHRIYSLDTSSPDFLRYLYCLIQNDEEEQYLASLQGPELTRFVNFLDGVRTFSPASFKLIKQTVQVLGVAPVTDDVSRRCVHKLRTICSNHAILPSSYMISGDLVRVDNDPVAFGGFSDVWEGTHNGIKVCIKHLRVSQQIREAVEKVVSSIHLSFPCLLKDAIAM